MNKLSLLKRKSLLVFLFFFIITYSFYFFFGLYHIGEFETADSHFWIGRRIDQYWNALFTSNWEKTRINDKPGITLAIISGSVDLKSRISQALGIKINPKIDPGADKVKKEVGEFRRYRLPILIFNGFFSLYFFWIIRKLTHNKWIALWSFILILLSPVLLGISQIENPDTFLWTFMTASLLSFLALLESREKKLIWLNALFLGLALLSKYTATLLYPFFFILALFFFFYRSADWQQDRSSGTARNSIIRILFSYLLIILGSLAIFSLLMPASFLNPKYLWDGTIGYEGIRTPMVAIGFIFLILILDALLFRSQIFLKLTRPFDKIFNLLLKAIPTFILLVFLATLINWNTNLFLFNPEDILKQAHELNFISPKEHFPQIIIYQFFFLVFALPPVVIFFLIFETLKEIRKKTVFSFLFSSLSLFLITFYGALTIAKLPATVRYSIVLYPVASILAALGVWEFLSWIRITNFKRELVTLLLILTSALSLYLIRPFYFNYASSLLPQKYALSYAWGFGGYEAAQYLNSLPDPEKIVVWSDYYGFRSFFKGKTYDNLIPEKNSQKIDYYVLTKKGWLLYNYWCHKAKNACAKKYVPAGQYYSAPKSVWQLNIDDRPENFIKIIRAE